MPSHNLNLFWLITNWILGHGTKLSWDQITKFCFWENVFAVVFLKRLVPLFWPDLAEWVYSLHGQVHGLANIITLRPRQNGRHFADDVFKCIFLNENVWIFKIPLTFVPKVPILTIFQHWFRYWLGAVQATSHYLNQWWLVYWSIYVSLGLSELNNPWRPSDVICRHRYISVLAQVMACCLTAPIHYLNQCWRLI